MRLELLMIRSNHTSINFNCFRHWILTPSTNRNFYWFERIRWI